MNRPLIKYWWSPNFGDKVNYDLVKWISGVDPVMLRITERPGKENYMVIGSILRQTDAHTVVWGSGFMERDHCYFDECPPKKIHAVRGPMTMYIIRSLGVACPDVFGDPALLIPRYVKPSTKKKYKLGILPHWVDTLDQPQMHMPEGVVYIKWDSDVLAYIDLLTSCEKVACSSMHGMITADAYGIPAIQMRFFKDIDSFKFDDYCMSVGRPLKEPLFWDHEINVKHILSSFYPYTIKIDLERLFNVCPFKKE
jgi:pyruvyltransferase